MSKAGAKTKATEETIQSILDVLRDGRGRIAAAKVAGIHYSTFLDWLENKAEFSEAVKKAEEDGRQQRKEEALESIRNAHAVNGQWQAAAWLLERQFPDEYAKREPNSQPDTNIRIEVNYKDGSDNPD